MRHQAIQQDVVCMRVGGERLGQGRLRDALQRWTTSLAAALVSPVDPVPRGRDLAGDLLSAPILGKIKDDPFGR